MNREEIIIENMPLVPFIVNKYFKNNTLMAYEDKIGYGNIGLIKAVDRYNEDKGKFSTYAFLIIRGEISNAIRDKVGKIGSKYDRNNGTAEIPTPFSFYENIINKETDKDVVYEIPVESFEDDEINKIIINSVLSKFNSEYKNIFYKHYFEGKTSNRIAKEIGKSQPTVSRRLNKIKKEIKNEIFNRI